MQRAGLVVLVLAGVLVAAHAHDWGWGACPKADPIPNFSVDKFLGLWYVIEQFDTSSTCQTLNYSKVSDTELRVVKDRQLSLLDTISVDHRNTYSARLDIPDGENASKMRVKWSLNIAGKADYIVFDTDYDTYAAIYECQQISSYFHRQSATILSRSTSLDPTFVDRVKRRMTTFGIQTHDFDVISHDACTQKKDADLNIDIDENTFKEILSSAADGISNVATQVVKILQVADGASSLATTVVDATRRLGASTDDASAPNAPVALDPDVEIIS